MTEEDKTDREVLFGHNQGGAMKGIQMISAISMPEPKPYYGIEPTLWFEMCREDQEEAKESYFQSVAALKSIYAALLDPIAVVK